MRISEIMSTAVKSVTPDVRAERAWTTMKTAGIHHLVVLDGPEIVGVVSERDLGGRRGAVNGASVSELMNRSVVVATPDMPLKRAANLMRGRSIGCLPVVDGRKVVGIVTVTDLLDVIGRGVERPVARGKRWTLTHDHGARAKRH